MRCWRVTALPCRLDRLAPAPRSMEPSTSVCPQHQRPRVFFCVTGKSAPPFPTHCPGAASPTSPARIDGGTRNIPVSPCMLRDGASSARPRVWPYTLVRGLRAAPGALSASRSNGTSNACSFPRSVAFRRIALALQHAIIAPHLRGRPALVASAGRERSLCLRDQPPHVTGRHYLWTAAHPSGSATGSTQVTRASATARGTLPRATHCARADHKENPSRSLTCFCPGDNLALVPFAKN